MLRKEAYVGEKPRRIELLYWKETFWKKIHFDRQACRVGRYELEDRSGDTHYYIVYKHPK